MRDDRASNRRGDVIAVKRIVLLCELSSGKELLIGEIVAGVSVIVVRAGLGGHGHLNRAGASVVDVVGVGLDGGFLN